MNVLCECRVCRNCNKVRLFPRLLSLPLFLRSIPFLSLPSSRLPPSQNPARGLRSTVSSPSEVGGRSQAPEANVFWRFYSSQNACRGNIFPQYFGGGGSTRNPSLNTAVNCNSVFPCCRCLFAVQMYRRSPALRCTK